MRLVSVLQEGRGDVEHLQHFSSRGRSEDSRQSHWLGRFFTTIRVLNRRLLSATKKERERETSFDHFSSPLTGRLVPPHLGTGDLPEKTRRCQTFGVFSVLFVLFKDEDLSKPSSRLCF